MNAGHVVRCRHVLQEVLACAQVYVMSELTLPFSDDALVISQFFLR